MDLKEKLKWQLREEYEIEMAKVITIIITF